MFKINDDMDFQIEHRQNCRVQKNCSNLDNGI